MLLEIPEAFKLDLPNNNFIWLSLYQIKALLVEDAWINPHVRGILVHV
jgi:oxidase EvaA